MFKIQLFIHIFNEEMVFLNNTFFPDEAYKKSIIEIPSYSISSFNHMSDLVKNNIGKQVCVYLTFPNSNDFRDFKIEGILEQSGEDYVILSVPSTGKWHLIPSIYIDLITFDENVNYGSNN